tara:strand:- start:254 stop:1327 length:1074 start_codon:yes stop_codon:yes gene_type:complete
MKKLEFIIIKELINIPIIKKYTLLSNTEYSKNNPISREKHLIWKYIYNPEGLSYGINGYSGNKLIARISYQKRKFIFKNKIINGANLCDLLIHKKNRNLDIFFKLTNPFFIKKDIPMSDLSIMLPNEISINIYKKILHLNPIGSLELRVIPIINSVKNKKLKIKIPSCLTYYSNKFLKFTLYNFQNISKINFSFNEVDNKTYEIMIRNYYDYNLIQGERSKKWILWRYNSKSTIKYFLEYIYLDDLLIGYIAYREAEKYGLKILVIMEIVITKKSFFIEITLLFKLIFLASKLKCNLIISLRTPQKSNPLSNILFPRIPKFILPTPLELFIVDNDNQSNQLSDIKNWKINMADFDIF